MLSSTSCCRVQRALPMQAGVNAGQDGFCRMDAPDLRANDVMYRTMAMNNEGGTVKEGNGLGTASRYMRGLAVTSNTSVVSFTSRLTELLPHASIQFIPHLEDRDIEGQLRHRLFLHFFTMAYFVGFFWLSTLKEGGFYQPNSRPCVKGVIITSNEPLVT